MIIKYIKVSFRRILKQKGISLINIVGLAIGFALSFIVLIYLLNETRYDKQHINKDRIFRLLQNYHPEASDANYITIIYKEHFNKIRSDYPEISKLTGLYRIYGELKLKEQDKVFSDFNLIFSNSEIMDVFTLPLIYGNQNEVLKNPFDIVITQSKARAYFNELNPVGKTLSLYTESDTMLFTVKGVMKDFPTNSTFKPDIICRYNAEYNWKDYMMIDEVYLLLNENVNYQELEKKLPIDKVDYGAIMVTEFKLQPFSEIYFKSDFISNYSKPQGNFLNVIILYIVGVVILFVSINNFLIFSIFDGQNIIKDLALRKVVGASMRDLRTQYFINAFVYSVLGFLFSIILVFLFTPAFNQLFAVELFKTIGENSIYIFAMVLILIFTGVFSGSYLAIYISSQNPIQLFHSSFVTIKSKDRLQKGIIIFQLFLFISLTAFSVLVNSQINFALERDSGYEKDGLLFLKLNNSDKSEIIQSEIRKLSDIESVSSISTDIPTSNFRKMHLPKYQNSSENVVLNVLFVGKDFFKTMKIPFCSENNENFSLEKGKYIINKAAALKLNVDPKNTQIDIQGKGDRIYHIACVCKNFDIQGIQYDVFPMAIVFRESPMEYLLIRSQDENATYLIEKAIHKLDPDLIFSIFSLKDKMSDAYTKESNFLKIIILGSLIVIIISAIGLFNVILLSLRRRTKEISIRKVLGANEISVNKLILKESVLQIVIANVIAIPIAIWGIKIWFKNFAYQVNINSSTFILTAFLSVAMVCLITVVNVKILMRKNLISKLNTE
jgi:putative ABC transport system permease protein